MGSLMDMNHVSNQPQHQSGLPFDSIDAGKGAAFTFDSKIVESAKQMRQQTKQKFKSRHFPEPYWGYFD